ncbi:hypothetical protein [Acetivibrio cellulolyticus]|uniref:hypothetical protein n=1 Tax=Acetivibrio cellulolyticus TaxID=35830 RepID=UPI0001E2E6B3|nr:hypothetical protein [Acetivibrio cellulolyticus]
MANKIDQSNSTVHGDQVAGDKVTNVVICRDIAKASIPIRDTLSFDINCDKDNTTLLRKLRDGKAIGLKSNAIKWKLKTLGLLLKMCESEEGKQKVADIYDNLVALIESKFIAEMDDGDLLKEHMDSIYEEFKQLVIKYEDFLTIDEAFLYGLLYIATSNCAIRWKVEDVS